ncbi:redoxin domain-containing protein [bacterium]|nr:redoxin domain-containing protein [bacterium]
MYNCRLGRLSIAAGLMILLLVPIFAIGQAAKDFTLRDINTISGTYNQQVTLSDEEGAIIVLFFFTSRPPAGTQRAILSSFADPGSGFWQQYKSECVRFFAIAGFTGESEADVLGMIPNLPSADFPVLYDPDGAAWGRYDELYASLSGAVIPLAVIIDHDFQISDSWSGAQEAYNTTITSHIETLDPYDTEGPTFENFSPANGATGVSLCQEIEFDILDTCGVNIDTLSASAGGQGVSTDTERIAGGYHVSVSVLSDCWAAGTTVNLIIGCADSQGNQSSGNYSFTTVAAETTPPELTNLVPGEDANNVDQNVVISMDVYDDESCIDRASLQFFIKLQSDATERNVTNGATITELTDHQGYHISYDHSTPFTIGESVDVHIIAEQQCGTLTLDHTYSFRVGTGGPSFTNHQPARNATNVDPGSVDISVDITDATSDINYSSIGITLNGQAKASTISRITNGYRVALTETNLQDGLRYTIRASACNTATSPKCSSDTWYFTTTDNSYPIITKRRPASDSYNISTDSDIFCRFSDVGVGVAQSSIRMWVNGTEVSSFTLKQYEAGDDAVIDCTYVPPREFNEGETVEICAFAADNDGNAMPEADCWTFTCSAIAAVRMAGWGLSELHSSKVGEFEAWAVVEYGEGMSKLRNVQMYTMNPATKYHYPTGIFLEYIGAYEGAGVFYHNEYITRGNPAGMLPIQEIAAEDVYGEFSTLWPYLTIIDKSQRGPESPRLASFDPTDVPWRLQALIDRYGTGVQSEQLESLFLEAMNGEPTSSATGPIPLVNTKPVIFVGGFYPPMIDVSEDSEVILKALVLDADGGDDIERVEVYVDGMPTGILLLDDGTQSDDEPGDGFYIKSFDVEAGSYPAGLLLVQIVAFDRAGNASNIYPYITVEP